jgi:hypothetical protein
MQDVSLTIGISLATLLAGMAIAWGALRTTVTQLNKIVEELRADVRLLRGETQALREELAEMRGRQDAEAAARSETTGRHRPVR